MYRTVWILLTAMTFSSAGFSQSDPQMFKIFNKSGRSSTWKKLVKRARNTQVVFFGEYHDDPVIHYLQLRLMKELIGSDDRLALGLEMIEWQDAEILNSYMSGNIDFNTFLNTSTSGWINFKTDYKPLVDLAIAHGLHVFASNVPRYLASAVYKGGFDVLDTVGTDLLSLLPPLPIPYNADLPGYKNMLKIAHGHGGANLPKAQALRDAAMAWSVIRHLDKGYKILHLNGTYHTNHFEGIIWYLNQFKEGINYVTIAMVRQTGVSKLQKEYIGLADFIIAVPEDMIRTH